MAEFYIVFSAFSPVKLLRWSDYSCSAALSKILRRKRNRKHKLCFLFSFLLSVKNQNENDEILQE